MSLCSQSVRRRLRTVIAVLGVMSAGLAFASPPHGKRPDAKHQLEGLEEQWRIAQLAGDTATMEKMLSDDYLGISMTGEVNTKAQQLRRVADRRLTLTKIELSDMKVKLIGAIGIVTCRALVEGTNDGQSVMGAYRYTRIYRRLPSGQWKITSFEATHEHHSNRQVNEVDSRNLQDTGAQ